MDDLAALITQTRSEASDITLGLDYAALVPLTLMITKDLITIEDALERAEHFQKMLVSGSHRKAAVPLDMLISTLRVEQRRRSVRQPRTWEPKIVQGGREPENSDQSAK